MDLATLVGIIAAFGLVSSLALLTSWGWAVDLPLVVGVTGLADYRF